MEKIHIRTNKKNELIDITKEIQRLTESAGVESGLCAVFCPHTTAGLVINENYDPAVKGDVLFSLEKISPNYKEFMHSENNSDAHVKSSLVGQSITFIIKDSKLLIGQWQGVFFAEFDGPRSREVWLEFVQK